VPPSRSSRWQPQKEPVRVSAHRRNPGQDEQQRRCVMLPQR
jgi:hypothetical protein